MNEKNVYGAPTWRIIRLIDIIETWVEMGWEEKKRWNALWCIYILFNTKCYKKKEIENKYLREIVQKEVKQKEKKEACYTLHFISTDMF